ncbi:BTB/POZ domain-containing protein KCTD16 [Lingula anatina]|uniref:BTB/POZ domain-containing protein KCTD16 n=1 Tax=Lingula anatina TaxID=7574 RepID=A0A1S3IN95_LINAN|nr:BTB/POZ domain-containing protein KCTD16-like [Lingula anatina]XP_013417227.1 BTB/POZ domain-containing protein KCTD16 [Lingula anatina]|eukprot:XP_013399672.1 BTB/POZ domain-containing protein KCTD16-like [Lingula anatina]
MTSNSNSNDQHHPAIVELNVGGVLYSTTSTTLTRYPNSYLGKIFTGRSEETLPRDSKGKYFLDRDGVLFRYVLDFLRNQRLVLPENFQEKERLKHEAEYFQLPELTKGIKHDVHDDHEDTMDHHSRIAMYSRMRINSLPAPLQRHWGSAGYITLGYRGTFAFGRDGLVDVKFRKLTRLLVCGRVSLLREAFGETLNESRDPDRGPDDRYTGRFFLKHTFLEQAFDMLAEAGFHMASGMASGTNGADVKPGMEIEESRWQHYTEFVFYREPGDHCP